MRRALLLLALAGCSLAARAQAPRPSPASDLESILHCFGDSHWQVRASGFYRLLAYGGASSEFLGERFARALVPFESYSNEIHLGLISLLATENYTSSHPSAPSGRWGEDFENYYGDVIAWVGTLGDPRAIPALAGAIRTGGDATGPLASFGDLALPAVLPKLESEDVLDRSAAISVLVMMLGPIHKTQLTPQGRARARAALLKSLRSPVGSIANGAAFGLAELGDPSACPRLRQIQNGNGPASLRKAAADAVSSLNGVCR